MIFFDLETTGLSTEKDRIIQFYGVCDDVELQFFCNPEIPVETSAAKAHGYTLTDLKAYPTFASRAREVQLLFPPDQIIVGYNSRTFDTPLLHNELQRAGERGLLTDPMNGDIIQPEIDLLKLWRSLEPRNLAGAARRFGVELPEDDLHDARVDTSLLRPIMEQMLSTFGHTPASFVELTAAGEVDRAGKFKYDPDGNIIFGFGKFADGIAIAQPGYLRWMIEKGDFPVSTLAVARKLLIEKGHLA